MNVKFGSMLCCLIIAIAGCSSTSTTGSSGGSPDGGGGAKIVGKWIMQGDEAKMMPDGTYMEFTADGKVTMNMNLQGKMKSDDIGTYKVDGDKLTMTAKKGGKDDTETDTIKSLTDDELVIVDPKGKEAKFKRMK